MMLRDLLSKLKWDHREDLPSASILYVDRSPDSAGRTVRRVRSVPGSSVVEIGPGYMTVEVGDGVSHIPYHRVTEVRNRDGSVRWSRDS
jgi:uncharacterized protein (UPF0248 family)